MIRRYSTALRLGLLVADALSAFGLFIVIALSSGTTFNLLTIALPKIVDERLAANVPLLLAGSVATLVLICGAVAPLARCRTHRPRRPRPCRRAVMGGTVFAGVTFMLAAAGPAAPPPLPGAAPGGGPRRAGGGGGWGWGAAREGGGWGPGPGGRG